MSGRDPELIDLPALLLFSGLDILSRHSRLHHTMAEWFRSAPMIAATFVALFVGVAKLAVDGALRPSVKKFRGRWALLDVAISTAKSASLGGLWLEFGVAAGESISYIAKRSRESVVGFDSFEGLPEDWNLFYRRGAFSMGGIQPKTDGGVSLVKGMFHNTLPQFLDGIEKRQVVSFLHVDSDLYSSARVVLEQLAPRITSGTVLVFDEYCQALPDDEARALRETAGVWGWKLRFIGIGARGTGSLPVAIQVAPER